MPLATSAWLFVQHVSCISSSWCLDHIIPLLRNRCSSVARPPCSSLTQQKHPPHPNSSRAVGMVVLFLLFDFTAEETSIVWPECEECYGEVDVRGSAANSPPFTPPACPHAALGRSGKRRPQHMATQGRRRGEKAAQRNIWLLVRVTSGVSVIECPQSRLYVEIFSSSLSSLVTFFPLFLMPRTNSYPLTPDPNSHKPAAFFFYSSNK